MKKSNVILVATIVIMMLLFVAVFSACDLVGKQTGNNNNNQEKQKYTVTVTNGTGSGEYEAGATVTITADPAPSGKEFKNWTAPEGLELDNSEDETTTFIMPESDVTVVANYKKETGVVTYTVRVVSGNGGGKYKAGAKVRISADDAPSGYEFECWISDSDEVNFNDATNDTTTFTMPSKNVVVEATYKEVGGKIDPDKPIDPNVPVVDTYTVPALEGVAKLIGGTKTAQLAEDSKWLIMDLTFDIVVKDAGNEKKLRISIRANIDLENGNDECAVKILDMTNANVSGDPVFESDDLSIVANLNFNASDIAANIQSENFGDTIFGFYMIGSNGFIDLGDDKPLLYLEDFDFRYVVNMIDNIKGFISDGKYDGKLQGDLIKMLDKLLKDSIGMFTASSLIDMLVNTLCGDGCKVVETKYQGNVDATYNIPMDLNTVIEFVGSLVPVITGVIGLSFDLDLEPIFTFIQNGLPKKMKLTLGGQIYNGKTNEIVVSAIDNTSGSVNYKVEVFRLGINMNKFYATQRCPIGIPDRAYNNVDFESFSLTNIALDLDIILDSEGEFDLGQVINTFAGKVLIPESVLILDVATGLRLSAAIDLDLNYGKATYVDEKGNEKLVDNNLISLELYLVSTTGEFIDTEPLLGIYYMEGGLYVNVDHILDRYYGGSNIKIELEGIPNLIQYLIDLVTNAIDGLFQDTLGIEGWTNWKDLRENEIGGTIVTPPDPIEDETPEVDNNEEEENNPNIDENENEEEEETNAQENEEAALASEVDEAVCEVECVSLAINEFGQYQVSLGFITFLKAIGSIVGFSDIFGTNDEQTAIVITINSVFWKALTALAGDLGWSWPGGLNAELALNFDEEGTLDNITIAASVDPRTGFINVEDDIWYVGLQKNVSPLMFISDGNMYADHKMTVPVTLEDGESLDDFTVIYISGGIYYLDAELTAEILVGKNNLGVYGAYELESQSTGVAPIENRKGENAYVYNGKWVVGNGLDDGEFNNTNIESEGFNIAISVHDMMFCYTSDYLDRFNPEVGGTSYKGYFGSTTNLGGYVLYRTHKRQIATDVNASSKGIYYTYDHENKEYNMVVLGDEDGQSTFDPNETYYEIVEKDYVSSVSNLITEVLGGTFLSLNLCIDFTKGQYNLAPLIAMLGVDSLVDSQFLWEFTEDFSLDANLNIGIALDKANPKNSRLVLEVVTNDKPIVIGEEVLFAANSIILGVYGIGNNVYVKLSNLRLMKIKLPDLTFNLDYTTLLYTLIGDNEILDLKFNLEELLGINKSTTKAALDGEEGEEEEGEGQTGEPEEELSPVDNLMLFINSNIVRIDLTINALMTVLSALGIDLGVDLASVMQLAVDLTLNRTEGISLTISGALIPKWTEENGNDLSDNLVIHLEAGTDKAPIEIGDISKLLQNYEGKFATIVAESKNYHDNLINALLALIGDLSLELRLDAETVSSEWNITSIINNIVADRADEFNLPLNVSLDDWDTYVIVKLQWYLDFANIKNTQVLIELRYEENLWLGLYIYQNSIVVDANGLGLFDFEIANSTIVAAVGDLLVRLIDSVGNLTLTSLLGDLLNGLLNPSQVNVLSEQALMESEAGNEAVTASENTVDEGQEEEESLINVLLGLLLTSVKATDTSIALRLTKEVVEELLLKLLGFNIYLDIALNGDIDILAGTIAIGANIEDAAYADITLKLGVGERGAYKFEMDLADIPDWNAISGEYMVRSLLKNLELGFYIDLNQYTSTTGQAMYTRIYIEKLTSKRSLPNTQGHTAARDSILITLKGITEKEFNNAGSDTGNCETWLFAELDWNIGKLRLSICEGFLPLKIIGIINLDVGKLMKILEIDLDLVNMLSGTIDNLLDSITSLITGIDFGKADDIIQGGDIIIDNNNTEEVEDTSDVNTVHGTIKATTIVTSGELDRQTTVKNIGKYFFYNNGFVEIEENGSSAKRTNLTISNASGRFEDLPRATASNYKRIYKVSYTEGEETITEYYMCDQLTRRTYGYFKVEPVSGLAGLFNDLDLVALISSIDLNLQSTGILNADITVDEYQINYLIDHLMYYIFGPETILNLQELTKDAKDGDMKFNDNYLASVYWDRINANNTFKSLYDNALPGLLSDVIKSLASINLSGKFVMTLVSNLESTLKKVINRLIPFAVSNETHLGLNIIDGQISNIYLTLHDHNQAILDPDNNIYKFYNGKDTLEYRAGNRNAGYFTELWIYNTSASVGNEEYIGQAGVVTWDGVPSHITYNPYLYSSHTAGYNIFYNKYFNNKVAKYQKSTQLFKSNIDFKIVKFRADGSEDIVPVNNQPINASTLDFSRPGDYYIKATASFNNGNIVKELDIIMEVQCSTAISEIEPLKTHVYNAMPTYIMTHVADGTDRRVPSELLTFYTKSDLDNDGIPETIDLDSSGNRTIRHEYAYKNPDSLDGSWVQTVYVLFPNGFEGEMEVTYLDSTIANTIISGASNNQIIIDLYQFDTKSEDGTTTKLSNYTPERLFFAYPNKEAYSLIVDEWNYGNASQLFDRLDPSKAVYGSVEGAEYKIWATVNKGKDTEQTVEITFVVPSKRVTSVSFGTKLNTLDIQPYEYYLYLSDNKAYAQYNPYQDKINVNYDSYAQQVYVKWNGIDDAIQYNWDNNNDYISTAQVSLDADAYPSGDLFTWTQSVKVSVSRNEISAIYFDEALTQTNLIINPYVYKNTVDIKDYYPNSAFIKFTNGKILKMPIAWNWAEIEAFDVNYALDYTQFTVSIGYDMNTYETTGSIVPFMLNGESQFLQSFVINVKVDAKAVVGIGVEGSEYVGGIYVIDPVVINYQGGQLFPSFVTVIYSDDSYGSINVINWEYDFDITMYAQRNLVARCWLTSDLYFDINCEIVDRSEDIMKVDTSEITSTIINPFDYKLREDGSLYYDVLSNYLTVSYTTSYTINLICVDNNTIHYSQTVKSLTELSALKKELRLNYNYSSLTNTYIVEGETCKASVVYNDTSYELPVYWDTSRLTIDAAGCSEIIPFYFGYGTSYELRQEIELQFAAKTIAYVESLDYTFTFSYNGEGLSNIENRSGKVIRDLNVHFNDGTSVIIPCQIDLNTLYIMNGQEKIYNGFDNGKVYKTEFIYNKDVSVGRSTTGEYYIKGSYDRVRLTGSGVGYDSNVTYYSYVEAQNVDATTAGEYYINKNGIYVPVTLPGDGTYYSNTLTYFVLEEAEVNENTSGTFYVYDEEGYTYIELSGTGYDFSSAAEYCVLTISNYQYATLTVAYEVDTLAQDLVVKVYVI